jgi:citronellol/citronellal dehydrogenase
MTGGRRVLDRSLKDRVVVVTGASRGIGRQIAVRAAADDTRLLFADDAPAHPVEVCR